MSSIAESLASVKGTILEAARDCGRDPSTVRLIAVSKTKPSSMIREAYAAGQRDFGENYVQELVTKAEELRDLPELRWHMIGHLQRNKVRHIAPIVHELHTVDSERLAEELNRRLSDEGRCLPVLIEVNVSGEESKSGCSPHEAAPLCDLIRELPSLNLRGLMTIPPFFDDPAESRPYFDRLRELRDSLGGPAKLPELSMGMTDDLASAIAAGATSVRIGTAIFGARSPRV